MLTSCVQSKYLKLEVENEQLQKQHDDLIKGTSHTSERINFLEKQNIQLRRELEKAQVIKMLSTHFSI